MKGILNDGNNIPEGPLTDAFKPYLSRVLVATSWDVNVDVDRGVARVITEGSGLAWMLGAAQV